MRICTWQERRREACPSRDYSLSSSPGIIAACALYITLQHIATADALVGMVEVQGACCSDYVEHILRRHPSARLRTVLSGGQSCACATINVDRHLVELMPSTADPESYRFQVLLSWVEDGSGPRPSRLVRHGYRCDAEYFYPARYIAKRRLLDLMDKIRRYLVLYF